MRTFSRVSAPALVYIGLGLTALGLSGFGAVAFDGTRSPSDTPSSVTVDLAPRAGVGLGSIGRSSGTVGATTAAAGPALGAPELRPDRRPTPGEAFRSGARAVSAGDTQGGLMSLEYAAANGHAAAQWKLGRMYAAGEGVQQNDIRAFDYFREIAGGHAEESPGAPHARFVANAFVALGNYYLDGIPSYLKPDAERARDMFAYAASYFGDPDAQFQLGRMYLEGAGGTKEPRQAARWLQLAANKGQHQAQAVLGAMLFKGDQVSRQAARGLMWLTLARDAASPQETWVTELHAAASAEASVEEQALALRYIEQWLKGRRE